jgi:hypothetical protein
LLGEEQKKKKKKDTATGLFFLRAGHTLVLCHVEFSQLLGNIKG